MSHPDQTKEYKKPQRVEQVEVYSEIFYSWIIIGLSFLVLTIASLTAYNNELTIIHLIVFFIIVFLLMNFCCYQVSIEKSEVICAYGIGLFKTGFVKSDVENLDIKPNNHLVSWIYNPRGETNLIVKFRGGHTLVVITNNARYLLEQLRIRA